MSAETGHDPQMESRQKSLAFAVHLYTASGILWVFLAVKELFSQEVDARIVIAWLMLAVLVDASDGPLARHFRVEYHLPHISGRTIDDIVDYLSFTFVPLLLVWQMDWLIFDRQFSWIFIIPALVCSLWGFANVGAKDEQGFFLGFPSYWNIFAFFAGILFVQFGALVPTVLLLLLSVATVLPIRFLYPNRAPHPWRYWLLLGGFLWFALLVGMLPWYPDFPTWLILLASLYPLVYTLLSLYLDRSIRKNNA